MTWEERIDVDPAILVGKPVIRGTRMSVEFIMQLLANGWSFDDILASYSHLTRDDILACLAYAHNRFAAERVYPVGV